MTQILSDTPDKQREAGLSDIVVKHGTGEIVGVRIIYRETGPQNAPIVLLPHGYPASTFHMSFHTYAD